MNTELKLFIDTPGDMSVGIPPIQSTILIQDNCEYDTPGDINELKARLKCLYEDQGQVLVRTELEFLNESLKGAIESRDRVYLEFQELNRNLDDEETEAELLLYKEYKNMLKIVGNLKRKITKLRNAYDEMGVWYPKRS
jgi:hypothetical protein